MNVTYLKLQDKTVLSFNTTELYFKIHDKNLLPFMLRDSIADTSGEGMLDSLPLKDAQRVIRQNETALGRFLSFRSLSVNRENAKQILNQLRIPQKSDFETNLKTMIMCKALSASDDFWITNDMNEKWADVNLRENPLHETLQQIALFGKSLAITGKLRTPELTGQGAYAKAWYREDGVLYLYKAGFKGGDEAEREALASRILDCFNVPQVQYELTEKDGRTVTKCRQMNSDDYSVVDAIDIDVWGKQSGQDLFDFARQTDSDLFYKTIVADYLLSNADRHFGNWGFYMSNRTGEIIGMHPLFDHNNCFDPGFIKNPDEVECQLIPGKKQRESALYAIKHCDFRCVRSVTRNMFSDKKMYDSFMERAVELGLYRKTELSLREAMLRKDFYRPVEIKPDNKQEYWDKINARLQKERTAELKESGVSATRHFTPDVIERIEADAKTKSFPPPGSPSGGRGGRADD